MPELPADRERRDKEIKQRRNGISPAPSAVVPSTKNGYGERRKEPGNGSPAGDVQGEGSAPAAENGARSRAPRSFGLMPREASARSTWRKIPSFVAESLSRRFSQSMRETQ